MAGLEVPNINEFIAHPDYQQTAAFFLGAVFITSLNFSSLWIRSFFPRLKKWISRNGTSSADIENASSEKASITSSLKFLRSGDNQSLVFTLSLCFTFASIAYFGSLLSFSPNGGATCAFVVAWGGMAAQTARLIGLVILLLELRDLGIAKLELYITFACLFVTMVLVFVNNAVGTGSIRVFDPLGIAICYRKHFLPTALATSLIYLIIEFFMLLRLSFLIMRQTTLASQRAAALRDGRIVKALSLLFLELLTIGPSAVHITLLADLVPLSIGALAVLAAFNYRSSARDGHTLYPSAISPIPVVPAPPIGRTGWLSRRSFGSSFTRNNSPRAPRSPDSPQPVPTTIPHPFSAQYLNNTAFTWPRQSRQQASRISTTETTLSTHEGVIRTVERSGPPVSARAVFVSSDDILPIPKSTPEQSPDVPPFPGPSAPFTSITTGPEVLVRSVTSPSPALSPTSLLMHPWHERRRPGSVTLTSRFSMDASDELQGNKSPTSTRGSGQVSYGFRGHTIPVPQMPSPSGPMRRYSSATLTSPMISPEGGQPRQFVQLLTFESSFRKGERREDRNPVLSSDSSAAPRR
ncbi:hypothetical protein D9615_000447 [Tricholomella constricta]|uniref:Transmembrane protein n=1 Tax=Tricholomella constricta TaxID=117010 RepID=A0A8H5HR82_9AGAR|nr:hypothetical protein D9615_000447 [Tricholomella constricta]